jgi:hypothetical protein
MRCSSHPWFEFRDFHGGEDSSRGPLDWALCTVVAGYQRFTGSCCLHLQGEEHRGSLVLRNVGFLSQHNPTQPGSTTQKTSTSIIIDLVPLIMFSEEYKLWSSAPCSEVTRIFAFLLEQETKVHIHINHRHNYSFVWFNHQVFTRAVWKVCGLTLFRVGTLWRCGDDLFCEVPSLTSDTLLTTLHPLLENVLQTIDHFEISCLGAPFSWLKKPRNRMGRDLDCMADVLMGFHRSTFSKPNTEFNSNLALCDFWASPNMKRELRGKKCRSDQRSAARYREVGGAL